jgi:hypothetical protein
MRFRKTSVGVTAKGLGDASAVARSGISTRRVTLLPAIVLLTALSIVARAPAQLPEAPTPAEIAPLRRFSMTVGIETSYSLTTSLNNLTSRTGVTMRIGQHGTLGLSYSHATAMNDHHIQNSSVVASFNIRAFSWGRIPLGR